MNSGPLAPQARNINHLQTSLTENKRLEATRFGRQMDAKLGDGWFGLQTDSRISFGRPPLPRTRATRPTSPDPLSRMSADNRFCLRADHKQKVRQSQAPSFAHGTSGAFAARKGFRARNSRWDRRSKRVSTTEQATSSLGKR